jgi:predicted Zn finger-like uncharacterized protein
MLIVCPQCAASYDVSPASLGADGRSVRCVSCRTIWFAPPAPQAEEQIAGPAEIFADFDARIAANEAAYAGADTPAESVLPPDRSQDTAAPGEPDPFDAPAPVPALDEAPSIVPPLAQNGLGPDDLGPDGPVHAALDQATPPTPPGEDVESHAARRAARRKHHLWNRLKGLKRTGWPALLVGLGGVIFILLVARDVVVRYAPQTASFYATLGLPVNLRGLDFEDIRVTRETQDGIPVLVVEGRIVTSGRQIAEVPRLRFAIHDDKGREIYTWTMMPSRSLLGAGETLPFRSRLASPPAEGANVSLRFFNRRDATSGFR